MLKTIDILNKFDLIEREQYKDMLNMVNIPDFYKCISQFSGLRMNEISDDTMAEYLMTWCKNKYRFFKMMGSGTRIDIDFEYNRFKEDIGNVIEEIGREYPAYYLWLREFKNITKNKIEERDINWSGRDILAKLFPQYNVYGSTLTHFLKSKLNAPDDLVTKIGRIFENDKIQAKYTISIDPVDMMLASENPYNWTSCYRLELDRDDSHADGCMAAVLDTTSLITYVWEKEGEFNLYDNFKFKNIRYYRMRQWIAISKGFEAIHFNSIYPGKSYEEEFYKQLRNIVETLVAQYMHVENKWRKNAHNVLIKKSDWQDWRHYVKTYRHYGYGYNEYENDNIYINNELYPRLEDEDTQEHPQFQSLPLLVYDVPISCPCGCGGTLTGSDEYDDDYAHYNGEGFVCENWCEEERLWCEYLDDYCTYGLSCNDYCEEGDCSVWCRNNPTCDIDGDLCDDPDWDELNGAEEMQANANHCSGCPRWQDCHSNDEE